MANLIIARGMGYVDKLEKDKLLNYFNIDNMDMKKHVLIGFFISMWVNTKKKNTDKMGMKSHM